MSFCTQIVNLHTKIWDLWPNVTSLFQSSVSHITRVQLNWCVCACVRSRACVTDVDWHIQLATDQRRHRKPSDRDYKSKPLIFQYLLMRRNYLILLVSTVFQYDKVTRGVVSPRFELVLSTVRYHAGLFPLGFRSLKKDRPVQVLHSYNESSSRFVLIQLQQPELSTRSV